MASPLGLSFHALSARHLIKEEVKRFRGGPPGAHIPVDWDGDINTLSAEYRADMKKREGETRVCIVGAGACGLRVAMFLQYLEIDFDILEASDRHGGRAFTYHFSAAEHDYYDVGAMRFPHTKALHETYNLFAELQLDQQGKIIPYIMSIPENLQLFNGELLVVPPYSPPDLTPFHRYLDYQCTGHGHG